MIKVRKILVLTTIGLMLGGVMCYAVQGTYGASKKGFEGVSWKPVVPVKKAFLIQADKWSDIDDYAYLASVPASTFYDKSRDCIFSSPVLFYDGSNIGTKYFLEDWTNVTGRLDEVVSINLEKEANLTAEKTTAIEETEPYPMAREIALKSWESSKTAVLAIIEGDTSNIISASGTLEGALPGAYTIKNVIIKGERDVGIKPVYHNFTIEEPYRYIKTVLTWDAVPGTGVQAQVVSGINIDMQLYDWQLGMVGAVENWIFIGMCPNPSSYVFHNGPWGVSLTYMPTKHLQLESVVGKQLPVISDQKSVCQESDKLIPRGPADKAVYTVNCTLYPGINLALPEVIPSMATNVKFELTWDNPEANLGLVVLDPYNNSVAETDMGKVTEAKRTLIVTKIGEGNHSLAVLKLNNFSSDVKFSISYSWEQSISNEEGDFMASATEGAVIGSILNAPLLYTMDDRIPEDTAVALKKLNVKEIFLIDLGNNVKPKLIEALKSYSVHHISSYEDVYSFISGKTGQNDIVFSTINVFGDSRFIGPAAFEAAHHGCPVFLVELHPELSCAAAWHSNYWAKASAKRPPPSVGSMVISGRAVYDFLRKIDFDRNGMESIITVGDEFNFGAAWDRTFPGAALPGRIMGNPTDASFWIARCVFYPFVIFANPALNPEGGLWITGSHSVIDYSTGVLNIKPGGEIPVKYPVLQTWVSYQHRFNERASKYFGVNYTGADGITPYWSPSDNPVDNDVNAKYGRPGCYYPDMTVSETVPFYLSKLNYGNVFSTEFDITMENLNRGVIMWIEIMHGTHSGGGVVGFWAAGGEIVEKNPWRGYEAGGSTLEPDTTTESRQAGVDVVPAPQIVGDIVPIHDGVVITTVGQFTGTGLGGPSGSDFDQALKNTHSNGVVAGSCLIAYTPLHMALIRHGSVFQIIDPWLTSWYCASAINFFVRELALGGTVGEAYERGIRHVGIEYLTNQWWWDIFENIVYFGDPDLKIYSPLYGWEKPEAVSVQEFEEYRYSDSASPVEVQGIFIPGFEIWVVLAALMFLISRRYPKAL